MDLKEVVAKAADLVSSTVWKGDLKEIIRKSNTGCS